MCHLDTSLHPLHPTILLRTVFHFHDQIASVLWNKRSLQNRPYVVQVFRSRRLSWEQMLLNYSFPHSYFPPHPLPHRLRRVVWPEIHCQKWKFPLATCLPRSQRSLLKSWHRPYFALLRHFLARKWWIFWEGRTFAQTRRTQLSES